MKLTHIIERSETQEDVESEHEQSMRSMNMINTLISHFRNNVDDYESVMYKRQHDHYSGGKHSWLHGSELGWPEPYDQLYIILAPEQGNEKGLFMYYTGDEDKTNYAIQVNVLPEDGSWEEKLSVGISRAISTQFQGVLVHEMQHFVQHIEKNIPFSGNDGTDAEKYYNSPEEFDAFYIGLVRSFHIILNTLRKEPKRGIEMLTRINYYREFKHNLDLFLDTRDPIEKSYLENLTKPRFRRLLKRLYNVHQAIMGEVDKIIDGDMVTEDTKDDFGVAVDYAHIPAEAGAGCFIMAADTKRFLMPLRSQWVTEPDTWGTWGGGIDRGEDPLEAVLREVDEEAGYNGKVVASQHLYHFQDEATNFTYDTYLVIVPTEFDPVLNWETVETVWVELGNWPQPLHSGVADTLKDSSVKNKLAMAASS